ncbi:MAG: XrtA-associated ATPase [Desulfobacteraceae bacterium]|nr:XrtA-associated ATPase [Desulfobacteraceae bacterium]
MYCSFFNLTCKPFDLIPNPDFMFLSKTHKKAITYLDYGIRERVGFVLLTGEVGSGKTTIIRELINKNLERVVLAKVFNTNVNSVQLLSMINDDFDLPVQGKDKIELLRDLNHFLVDQYSKGNQPLLIIDEAQNLPPETLEEIRMLSNLETSDSKLLQIILVGQPELRTLLARPELRQLRQRINFQCNLQPLNRQEMEEYIFHRLQVAGNRDAIHLEPPSLDLIFSFCSGIPRLINIICDFILLAAFAEEVRDIDEEMIREIIGDLDYGHHYWVQEQPDIAASNTNSSPESIQAHSHWTESRIEELFNKLNQRLSTHEKETLSAVQSPLKKLNERLEQFQNTFTEQLNKTNADVARINKKIEGQSKRVPETQDLSEKGNLPKQDLIRRIFK